MISKMKKIAAITCLLTLVSVVTVRAHINDWQELWYGGNWSEHNFIAGRFIAPDDNIYSDSLWSHDGSQRFVDGAYIKIGYRYTIDSYSQNYHEIGISDHILYSLADSPDDPTWEYDFFSIIEGMMSLGGLQQPDGGEMGNWHYRVKVQLQIYYYPYWGHHRNLFRPMFYTSTKGSG